VGSDGFKGEQGEVGDDADLIKGDVGEKGAVGATGDAGEDHTDCDAQNPTYGLITISSCVASDVATTDDDDAGAQNFGCESSYDGNPATEWKASQAISKSNVKYTLPASYQVVECKFTYRDPMSDRSGSVTVTGNDYAGHQMIESGIAQQRDTQWGAHSEVVGSEITLQASGGTPWQDGRNFGIKEVSFYGCPA